MKLRRSGMFTKLVLLALIVYGMVNLWGMWGRITEARYVQDGLAEQIERLESANAEREYRLENLDDDSVIEQIARDELGLVMPGEIVFYVSR